MFRRKLTLWLVAVASMGMLMPMLCSAQGPGRPLGIIEEAIESRAVELVFDENQEVVEVISGACIGCDRRVFPVAENFEVKVGSEVVQPTKKLSGKPATVIYSVESEAATAVNFFAYAVEGRP